MKLERIVEITPRNHGNMLRMVLKGELGAVQFVVLTNWGFGDALPEEIIPNCMMKPLPADLGYHSPKPMFEGDKPMEQACPYLDGKLCYYDGSGLAAHNLFEILVEKGSDGVWEFLENYYRQTFMIDQESEVKA